MISQNPIIYNQFLYRIFNFVLNFQSVHRKTTLVCMKEIQAVNACRRDAVANGMKLEEAMTKWQSMDQLPAEYRS